MRRRQGDGALTFGSTHARTCVGAVPGLWSLVCIEDVSEGVGRRDGGTHRWGCFRVSDSPAPMPHTWDGRSARSLSCLHRRPGGANEVSKVGGDTTRGRSPIHSAHAVAWALSPLVCFPACAVLPGLQMRHWQKEGERQLTNSTAPMTGGHGRCPHWVRWAFRFVMW